MLENSIDIADTPIFALLARERGYAHLLTNEPIYERPARSASVRPYVRVSAQSSTDDARGSQTGVQRPSRGFSGPSGPVQPMSIGEDVPSSLYMPLPRWILED